MEAIQQREISVLKEADPVPIEKNDNGTWFSQMLNVWYIYQHLGSLV